jgi:hypothetical protein
MFLFFLSFSVQLFAWVEVSASQPSEGERKGGNSKKGIVGMTEGN